MRVVIADGRAGNCGSIVEMDDALANEYIGRKWVFPRPLPETETKPEPEPKVEETPKRVTMRRRKRSGE